ncbi:hypothetical protein D9M71_455840 [compost metagenome]
MKKIDELFKVMAKVEKSVTLLLAFRGADVDRQEQNINVIHDYLCSIFGVKRVNYERITDYEFEIDVVMWPRYKKRKIKNFLSQIQVISIPLDFEFSYAISH